jgi:hypothetical protein
MEKIEADAARTKLERLKRAHEKGRSTLAWTKAAAETSVASRDQAACGAGGAAAHRPDSR